MEKAKKLAGILFLTAVLFVACGQEAYTAPIAVEYVGDGETVTAVNDFESELLLELLNGGKWNKGIANCDHDYIFTVNGKEFGFHSECGTFTDVAGKRSLETEYEDAEAIRESLKNVLVKSI